MAVIVAGLALPVTACGDGTAPGGAAGSLKGRSFLSTSVTEDGKPRQLVTKTRIRLQFTDDGRLLADAGCNSMQAPVSTGDGRLELEDLAVTEMGCDAPRHAQDRWLAGVLSSKPAWRLESDRLTITAANAILVLHSS